MTDNLTIAKLIQQNKECCVEIFTLIYGSHAESRVNKLIDGDRPTNQEIELMPIIVNVPHYTINELIERDYSN